MTASLAVIFLFSIISYLISVKFKPRKTVISQNETFAKNEININGAIFFNNTEKIEKLILSGNAPKTIISLENVIYIDASAIEMLTEAKHMLSESGKTLIIHTPSDKITKFMSKTDLIDEYTPFNTEE